MKYNLVEQVKLLLKSRYHYERNDLYQALSDMNNLGFPTIQGLSVTREELQSGDFEKRDYDQLGKLDISLNDSLDQKFELSITDYGLGRFVLGLSNLDYRVDKLDNRFYIEYCNEESEKNFNLSKLAFMYGKDYLELSINKIPHLDIYTNVASLNTIYGLIPDFECDFSFEGDTLNLKDGSDMTSEDLGKIKFINFKNEAISHKMIRLAIILDQIYHNYYEIKEAEGKKIR